MRAYHPEICLFEPEIPQNVGNIGRLCAATASRLHLVGPFPFSLSDKNLRRPGLDYWPYLDLEIHQNIATVLDRFNREEIAFFSAKGKQLYTEIKRPVKLYVFGKETKGLPVWIHEQYADRMFRLPIFHDKVRSLNLANTVSIIAYKHLELLQE